MITLDNFLPRIMPYAPGCSDLMAYQALRDTAIDFCRRSLIVQRVTAASPVSGLQMYAPVAPSEMQLQRVLGAAWQGRWLDQVAPLDVQNDAVLQGASVGSSTLPSGSPRRYFQKGPADMTFGLDPVPDSSLLNGLTVVCAYIPSQTAASLEDVLFDEYAEGLAAGTLSRLVVMPNQSFSSPSSAPMYKAVYEAAVNEAKRQRESGRLRPNRRVRPVAFG